MKKYYSITLFTSLFVISLFNIERNTKKTERILDYRGLYDLEAKDIHYGDIMITFGKVVK